MKQKPSVLIADRHELFRRGLIHVLEQAKHRIVADTNNGRAAVKLAAKHRPNVVMLDIHLPLLNGIEAARMILKASPRTEIVFLTEAKEDHYIQEALRIGVTGYVLKSAPMDILPKAIESVASGVPYFYEYIARRVKRLNNDVKVRRKDPSGLTSREIEIVQLIAEGFNTKEIADELNISYKTADNHRQKLFNKLDIHDVASITNFAIRAGYTKP